MIDLYAAGTSNSIRARIALEECALDYRLNRIDLEQGEHKTAAFLAMNPDGQIPVIVDHDGPGGSPLTLSQSTAILIYCAEKAGKFVPQDAATRPAMLQALMKASTDVSPGYGALYEVTHAKEPHAPDVQLFKGRLRRFFTVWDDAFAERRHCAGDEVTIADFSLFASYARVKAVVPDILEGLPNLARWGESMGARPAIRRALAF